MELTQETLEQFLTELLPKIDARTISFEEFKILTQYYHKGFKVLAVLHKVQRNLSQI